MYTNLAWMEFEAAERPRRVRCEVEQVRRYRRARGFKKARGRYLVAVLVFCSLLALIAVTWII